MGVVVVVVVVVELSIWSSNSASLNSSSSSSSSSSGGVHYEKPRTTSTVSSIDIKNSPLRTVPTVHPKSHHRPWEAL